MSDPHDEMRHHDRRYMLFAVMMAVVVLAIAAVSITVVIAGTREGRMAP